MSATQSWAVEIRKNSGKVVWAWPYNVPIGIMPPYPGFEVLERWLCERYPIIKLQRLYNDGNPVLEVEFDNETDAFMFVLSAGQYLK